MRLQILVLDKFKTAIKSKLSILPSDSLDQATLEGSENAGLCQKLPETSHYAVCPVDPSCKYTATSRWFTGAGGKRWDFCQPRMKAKIVSE
jgi:hypothetical protein